MPGGFDRYIVEATDRPASQGVRAIGVVARYDAGEPTPGEMGLIIPALNSALSRRTLYAAWDRLGTPSVDRMLGVGSDGGTAIVYTTTWTIPPAPRPLVATIHDVAFPRNPDHFAARGPAYFHRTLEIAGKRANAIIIPSQAIADDCIEAGLDVSHIIVIPHGLSHTPVTDAQMKEFRSRYGLERPYVLQVGTRELRENLPTLSTAYEQICETDLDLALVEPVGWGTDPADAPPLPECIHVLGCLDDADLACAHADSHIFTFPSIQEGFDPSALEVMAHGTPVVTSMDACMAEIMGSDADLLVPATDASVLVEALEAVVGSGHDRLAAAGIERVGDYTWEAFVAAHAAVYAFLAGDR